MTTVTATRLVLATHNRAKLAELRRILTTVSPDLEVLGLNDCPPYPEPAETATTFAGNALLKARACLAATGLPSLADDSGLSADLLNGMPGVRSARWAGPGASDEDNLALLLRQLADVDPEQRTARFVCAVAWVTPEGEEQVRIAEMPGRLIGQPRGQHGFGYDPVFVADGETQTNAELDPRRKDEISHRGRALRAIAPLIAASLGREVA